MYDSEEKMCTLLEEWERQKKVSHLVAVEEAKGIWIVIHETNKEKLINDYFADEPVYLDSVFCRRFWMPKALFLRILEALASYSEYFQQMVNTTGKQELSPL